jgi:tetratricopeptide (TPR) repeat protein
MEVPLRLVLDADALAKQEENRPALLSLRVEYEAGELRVERSRSLSVIVYNKNALHWTEAEDSAAAFVTHLDPRIVARATAAVAAIPKESVSDPLAMPVALFRLLDGLRYAKDPVSPFRGSELDHVQYPAQTLKRGVGDCDDLAVLYAALAEAVGVPAMLLTMPGHVMVALRTNVPAQASLYVSIDPSRVITHGGYVWIPVETTLVSAPFSESWAQAVKSLARAREVGRIEVRKAWQSYPPANLEPAGDVPPPAPAAAADELRALSGSRKAELEKELAALAKEPVRADKLIRRAVLTAVGGDLKAARALIDQALKLDASSAAALNDLANLELLEGNAAAAFTSYRRALKRAPKSVQIHLNAAVAAWATGNKKGAAEHLTDGLDLARGVREKGVVEDFLAVLGDEEDLRGDHPLEQSGKELAREMRKLAEQRGLITPRRRAQKSENRQAGDPLAPALFLYWL